MHSLVYSFVYVFSSVLPNLCYLLYLFSLDHLVGDAQWELQTPPKAPIF